jgi:hypothetical protein
MVVIRHHNRPSAQRARILVTLPRAGPAIRRSRPPRPLISPAAPQVGSGIFSAFGTLKRHRGRSSLLPFVRSRSRSRDATSPSAKLTSTYQLEPSLVWTALNRLGSIACMWGNPNRLAVARQDGSGSCRRCRLQVSNAPVVSAKPAHSRRSGSTAEFDRPKQCNSTAICKTCVSFFCCLARRR